MLYRITNDHLQLAQFRTIQDEDGDALAYNFRPVQAVNDRIVYRYHDNDGFGTVTASLTLLSVTSVAAMLLLQ